jgi:excisionase family DNA binding protein
MEAAKQLGVSRAHFYRMHNAGRIPLPLRLGGAVRWRQDELEAWVAAGMPDRRRWLAQKGGAN